MEHELVNGTQPEKPELDNDEEEHEQTPEKRTPEEECRTELVSPTAWSMLSVSPPPAELGHCFDVDAGYDPNRIPPSVFSAPTTPSGWSATSNESLFSIHMGNNSFSRDNLYTKSGELKRLDDWPEDNANDESGALPAVVEEGSIASGVVSRVDSFESRMGKVSLAGEVVSDPITSAIDRSGSSSNARISEESVNSARSFAFPVLVGDGNLKKTTSVGEVADIPEEPHLEEKVSAIDKSSDQRKKKITERRCCSRLKFKFCSKFCCWCRHRG